MPRLALLVSLAGALALPACGGDGGEASPSSSTASKTVATTSVGQEADRKRAEIVVLTDSDLAPEWTPYGGDKFVAAEIECLQFEDDDLVLTAHVDGATFASGPPALIEAGKIFNRGSHVIISHARVYETEDQAEAAFDRFVHALASRPVARCLFAAENVGKGPPVATIQGFYYPVGKIFPRLAEDTWRQQYKLRISKTKDFVWLDLAVLRASRTLALLYSSSLEIKRLMLPTSDEFLEEAAGTMAKRLTAQR